LAGGGASIAFIDTLSARFPIQKIGNYGEYSGNPSRTETRLYCEQVFQLMINSYQTNPAPQAILIGGAIANFTDVAKTFQGICDAIKNAHEDLERIPVTFYIRRGGPNWQQGYKDIEGVLSQYAIPYIIQSQAKSLTEIVYQIELS
jgi:ATP-citrate lyase beta-subunit